jgi:threonine dehydratase
VTGDPVTHDDVLRAAETIRGRVRRTPLLGAMTLAHGISLKAELLQHTASF